MVYNTLHIVDISDVEATITIELLKNWNIKAAFLSYLNVYDEAKNSIITMNALNVI